MEDDLHFQQKLKLVCLGLEMCGALSTFYQVKYKKIVISFILEKQICEDAKLLAEVQTNNLTKQGKLYNLL